MMRKNTSPLKKQVLDVALNKSVLNLDNVIRDLNLILQIRSDFYERKTVINFSDLV
jgi:hypothetical protein